MAGLSASDVIRIGALAWDVYHMGWAEEYGASQQYKEFGADVKNLAENLDNIRDVVGHAQAKFSESFLFSRTRPSAFQREKDWDLSSLNEIIGDYNRTLSDCKKLLEENYEFRNNRNPLYNIEWNVVIQPRVEQLRRRLECHNSKITILLKPLELKLLSDVHRDLAARIDSVHHSVLRLQGLLFPDLDQAKIEQENVLPIPLSVPSEFQRRFQIVSEKIYPDVRFPGQFPLQAGAEAFVFHLKQSTKSFRAAGRFQAHRTPSPKQYLALLKCIWMIGCLQDSHELTGLPDDSQWPGYIIQLHEDLSIECQRFTSASTEKLFIPDLTGLRGDNEFDIWPEENLADYISPHKDTSLEEILRIPMPNPTPFLDRDMTVYRLDTLSKYRLIETIEDRNSLSSRSQQMKMDIDLKTLNFIPIYATPSSRQKPLQVRVDTGNSYTDPTFQESKYIYRLQHLLTGYKVYERYDQSMVTATFFVSGQKAPIVEHARIQLWLPSDFIKIAKSNVGSETSSILQNQNTQNSRTSLSARPSDSPTGAAGRGPAPPRSSPFRLSRASSSSRDPISPIRSEEVASSRVSFRSISDRTRHRTPSIMTTSSTFSRSSASSTTTISTGDGKAHLHSKPIKPLLVIFLKSQDTSSKLAIAAIEIDHETSVERQRCQCVRANSKCPISCLERAGGCLKIQRWDANEGLQNWNLARLSMQQRKEFPADAWHDIKRVSLCFDSPEARYRFSGSPCSCSPRTQRQLAQCVVDGHQGFLGEVKQIESQRLQNYSRERDDAARTSIVKRNMLDPLHENEG